MECLNLTFQHFLKFLSRYFFLLFGWMFFCFLSHEDQGDLKTGCVVEDDPITCLSLVELHGYAVPVFAVYEACTLPIRIYPYQY